MIATRQQSSSTGKEYMDDKRLEKIVGDWAEKNKSSFWKYEVSCFYNSYVIRITNLPNPSTEDIALSSGKRSANKKKMLTRQQKAELCSALAKACVKAHVPAGSCINVKIDYNDGNVVAAIV